MTGDVIQHGDTPRAQRVNKGTPNNVQLNKINGNLLNNDSNMNI